MKRLILLIITIIICITFINLFEQKLYSNAIFIATTTSVYNSGLLEYLLPIFESKYNIKVYVIPVGTGRAIEIAKRGSVDLIIVHSKDLEIDFLNSSYGVHRIGIMYNDFIIVGPIEDPANITNLNNVTEAFRRIMIEGSKGNAIFISRADKSGTHVLEMSIWKKLGINPTGNNWYLETGADMGTVLRMANDKKAYTITDRATWLSYELNNLKILVENDIDLINPYSCILVNPEKFPNRNYKGAILLVKWLSSEEGQNLIESYKKNNQSLFIPFARNLEIAHKLGYYNQEEEITWYENFGG
ncbi:MAG: substrate-binding domain-containing protein [Candidatus Methanomethylicaceae archaeon]|nr:substrate-binding domain-containing protein [Candidatus Verstraetearchaeota archaeon]